MSTHARLVINPYRKTAPAAVFNLPHNEGMGRQSQQRVSNTKRKYQLAATNSHKKPKKGDQLTLLGHRSFNSETDCKICVAQAKRRFDSSVSVPKRSHHELCVKNTKTGGKGPLTTQRLAEIADNRRYQHLIRPIELHEKGSWKHSHKEAGIAFFNPTMQTPMTTTTTPTTTKKTTQVQAPELLLANTLSEGVGKLVSDPEFCKEHQTKSTPLAMLALAQELTVSTERRNSFKSYFTNTLTMIVPPATDNINPHYHSIVGQKLLLVDWESTHGIIGVPCPGMGCTGVLRNDRTNWSKNKTLFPIFGLDGPPSWCMVQSMKCSCCKRRFDANESAVLLQLPVHVAESYPVEERFSYANTLSHLSRTTTETFDSIMLTYGNGEMCSKLLYNAINRSYVSRLKVYYSYCATNKVQAVDYVRKDGEYIKAFPPQGDTIRDMWDAAMSSEYNRWGLSDHDRHTLELQSVKCTSIMTQDHTFQVVKNYQKRLGAKAAWDVGTSTGEIASVILVTTTKCEEFAHAATQLLQRPHFNPKAMYSDTWPHKDAFWKKIGPEIEGRLGLFHFENRIISTLRKNHVDYMQAIADLLGALYSYCAEDYEKLLAAMKDGSLLSNGKKYSSDEVHDLKGTRLFRDRYAKYLRKRINEKHTIIQGLDDWFCRYKVTSSDPINKPAKGRRDPIKNFPLFTRETKYAVENCQQKAEHLFDPLPFSDMYDEIPPHPNSKHQLTEYLSRRGESKLEAFHDRLTHFANSGMRASLADNLCLAGTARWNINIRHKRSLIASLGQQRTSIPAGWEKTVPFYNHSELLYVNGLAASVGLDAPFPKAEVLPKDNGERFFSEYLTSWLKGPTPKRVGLLGECLCAKCHKTFASTPVCIGTANPVCIGAATNNPVAKSTTPGNVTGQQSEVLARLNSSVSMPATINLCKNTNVITAAVENRPTVHLQSPQHHAQSHQLMLPIQTLAPRHIILQQHLPLYFVTHRPTPSCCNKYNNWLNYRRRGRPPHDACCISRFPV